MRLTLLVPLLTALAGCEAPPEIDVARFEDRIPPAAEGTPALLPIAEVTAAEPPRADRGGGDAEVEARAVALRARVEALAGPVIPPAERERLEDARPGSRGSPVRQAPRVAPERPSR